MNMFRTRCMLFYFAKTIEFVSWGNTFPFCLHLFLRTFQQPNPFCCNRSTTNLFMISFLSRTIAFFFFFLSLWIYLWLAETSQQPISQTAWLKVTPHCNHWRPSSCKPCNLTYPSFSESLATLTHLSFHFLRQGVYLTVLNTVLNTEEEKGPGKQQSSSFRSTCSLY